MVDIAIARIERDGLGVGLDGIRMEDVIREAGVSRATAYRRWTRREDFLTDVLVETVRATSLIPESEADVSRVLEVVRAEVDQVDKASVRRELVVEALRIAVAADIGRIIHSPRWRTFLALAATYSSLEDADVRGAVGRALADAEREFAERRTRVYAGLADLIGYRPTGGGGPEALATLGVEAGLVMSGVVVGCLTRPDLLTERSQASLFGGRAAGWSIPERLVVGLVLQHLEPDPSIDWTPEYVASRFGLLDDRLRELFSTAAGSVGSPG